MTENDTSQTLSDATLESIALRASMDAIEYYFQGWTLPQVRGDEPHPQHTAEPEDVEIQREGWGALTPHYQAAFTREYESLADDGLYVDE